MLLGYGCCVRMEKDEEEGPVADATEPCSPFTLNLQAIIDTATPQQREILE